MAKALNFLAAILIVVGIATFALLTRSCGSTVIPSYFDRARTLEDARARSDETGRPMLVFLTADWCGYCDTMKRRALASSRVSDWITGNSVPVYVDVTKAASGDLESQALMNRLGVEGVPAILLLKNGREIGRVEGEVSARELLDALKKIAAPPPPADDQGGA